MCPTPVLSEFLNRLRRRRGILAEKTVNVFTVTTPSDYIYTQCSRGAPGTVGEKEGIKHAPLLSKSHSLAGFQVGRSRKDLHKEASVSNDNNSRILVFRLKGA